MADLFNLLRHLSPYKKYVFANILSQILLAVFTVISIPMIIPFFQVLFNDETKIYDKPVSIWEGAEWLEYTFNNFIAQYDRLDALLYICIGIVTIFLLKNIFRYLSLFFINPARNGIVKDLRSGMFKHLINIPMHELKTHKRGDIITRLTSDAQEVEWSILQVLDAFIKAPLTIIGSLAFMLYISPNLTLFVFVLMIFTIVIIGSISKTLKKESKGIQETLSAMTSNVDETVTGMDNVRSFNVQDRWIEKFESENRSFYSRTVKMLRRKDLAGPTSEFLGILVVAILLYYGSFKVFQGSFSAETFFAFIFAFYQIIEPSKSFSSAYYNYKKGQAAYERIVEFSSLSGVNKDDTGVPFKKIENQILFDKVDFNYPEQTDKALDDIKLSIKKGENIAFVGASGSGKTSMLNLLLKFYEPSSGQILIDGKALKSLSTGSWRKQIAMVTQQPFIFNDTIFENIKFGREGITREKAMEALDQARLSKFKGALDQPVGERGQLLSGGEKQRLAIARALAGDPELLLLDEPTSALDAQAENEVSQAIRAAMQDRTAIIIAHRFSTIKHADKIVVLDNGKIVQEGTHDYLSQVEGFYKTYLDLQV